MKMQNLQEFHVTILDTAFKYHMKTGEDFLQFVWVLNCVRNISTLGSYITCTAAVQYIS